MEGRIRLYLDVNLDVMVSDIMRMRHSLSMST